MTQCKLWVIGCFEGEHFFPTLQDTAKSLTLSLVLLCPASNMHSDKVAAICNWIVCGCGGSISVCWLEVNGALMSARLWEHALFSFTHALPHVFLACCLNFTWTCLIAWQLTSFGVSMVAEVVILKRSCSLVSRVSCTTQSQKQRDSSAGEETHKRDSKDLCPGS